MRILLALVALLPPVLSQRWTEPPAKVIGVVEVDFTFGAAPVAVTVGGPGARPDGRDTLEVRSRTPWLPAGVGKLEIPEHFTGVGCRLERGQRQVHLFLPHGDFELRLFPTTEEGRAHQDRQQATSSELTIRSEAARAVVLDLPEVMAPEKKQ